jgi:hypothetical protein
MKDAAYGVFSYINKALRVILSALRGALFGAMALGAYSFVVDAWKGVPLDTYDKVSLTGFTVCTMVILGKDFLSRSTIEKGKK